MLFKDLLVVHGKSSVSTKFQTRYCIFRCPKVVSITKPRPTHLIYFTEMLTARICSTKDANNIFSTLA